MSFDIDQNVSFHFTMEKKKYPYGSFTFKISHVGNGSLLASLTQDKNPHSSDDVGALYYVVAVIFIYGCSILMMIASYIRKNNTDRKLNRYIKEMATVRKRETQNQLLTATAKVANLSTKRTMIAEAKDKPSKSPRLSSVSEVLHDEIFLSDSECERKQQYQLLTPSPSPGRSPGNSPVLVGNLHMFSDYSRSSSRDVAKKYSKKINPNIVRWVCETETDGELGASESEQRLLKSPYTSPSLSPQKWKKDRVLMTSYGSQSSVSSIGRVDCAATGKPVNHTGTAASGHSTATPYGKSSDNIRADDVHRLLENKTEKVTAV